MMNDPSDTNAFGIWPGEVAIELPEKFDASLYFIGRIRTPWKERKDCPKNARESEAVCTIELDPRWAAGLKDVCPMRLRAITRRSIRWLLAGLTGRRAGWYRHPFTFRIQRSIATAAITRIPSAIGW